MAPKGRIFMDKAQKNQEKEMQENEVNATPGSGERLVRDVKRKTRRRYLAEEKIRVVLEGFRKELPISDLCRKEGIPTPIYYSWLKDFMEGGKKQLQGDTLRGAAQKRKSKASSGKMSESKSLWRSWPWKTGF